MLTPDELSRIYEKLPEADKKSISAIAESGGVLISAENVSKILQSCPDTIRQGARQKTFPFALAIKNPVTDTYKYKFSRPAFLRWLQEGKT